jgi:hypothetical protein
MVTLLYKAAKYPALLEFCSAVLTISLSCSITSAIVVAIIFFVNQFNAAGKIIGLIYRN